MLLRNGFNGGFDSSTITAANSGGGSGDAFTEVYGSPTYTSAHVVGQRAPLAAQVDSGDTLRWDIATFTVYARAYLYVTAYPGSDSIVIYVTYGFDPNGGLKIQPDGRLIVHGYPSSNNITATRTTNPIPTNQWVRVELLLNVAAGGVELRVYHDADSTTPTETKTASGQDLQNGIQPAAIEFRGYGQVVDDVAVSDEGWIGPAVYRVDQTVTPGVIAATTTMPPADISTGLTARPGLIAATTSMPPAEVFTGGLTTPVNPDVIAATTTMPPPDVLAFKHVTVTPDVIVATTSMPTPSLDIPVNPGDQITASGQIEWNGFLIGSGTPYRLDTLEGWFEDLPGMDSGNTPQPSRHGSYPGRKLGQERNVILGGHIRTPRELMGQVVHDLVLASPIPEDDTEYPLAIRVLDVIYVGYGNLIRRSIPVNKNYRLGHAQMTLQWVLSDPLLLSRELNSAVVPDGSMQQVANLGNAATYPLIRIPGPAPNPLVAIQPHGGSERVLEFGLEVDPGKTLIIDAYYGTVTIDGQDQLDTLTGSSVGVPDFVLPSGVSDFTYITDGGAPGATVLWRHAYL